VEKRISKGKGTEGKEIREKASTVEKIGAKKDGLGEEGDADLD